MNSHQTFDKVLLHWADQTPDAAALAGPGQSDLSYRDLYEIFDESRLVLAGNGIDRNDRVALVHSGGAEMAAAAIGISSLAAVAPFSPAMSAGEFYLHFQDKKIRALALESALPSAAREAAARLQIPVLDIVHDDPAIAGKIRLSGQTGLPPVQPENLCEEDMFVIFTTSGTTSYGKTVPLSHRLMLPRIRSMARSLDYSSTDRVLNIMPLFHTGGFSAGMMATLYSGGTFFAVKNNDVDALFRSLTTFRPTVIAGGYTVFHSIERKASEYVNEITAAKTHLRLLRTGTGHLDQKIARRLESIFETPVLEAYGSAETSFMACTGIPPAPRKDGSVGQPDRSRVFIVNSQGEPLPPLEKGEIAVTRQTAFDGYENNPAANREAFSQNWYHTGDEGYLDEDGFLFITGRIKEMINRGGVKIIPTEVDQAVLRHAMVREAVSFPLPHPTLGDDLALAVVAEPGQSLSEDSLRDFLKAQLVPNKIPSRILIVNAIPKGATGKAQRHKLADQLGLLPIEHKGQTSPAMEPGALPANTALLQKIWQQILGHDDIGLDDNFFALGGDSLQAVDLFMQIEKELGRRLPRDVLFQAGTVREMARLIEEGEAADCIVPIQPKGTKPPLFFVHPIGGEVLGYRKFARYLDPDQPFFGIQQYRSERGNSRFSSLEEMADYYLQEIREFQPVGPYYLGGHSFGGLIAYIIARKLAEKGEETGFLALLDTYLPNARRHVSPTQWLHAHYRKWKTLPAPEKGNYILTRVRNINALNLRSFRPEPYNGNAVLFRTELPVSFDPAVHDEWQNLILGDLEICDIPGGHVEIMEEPIVQNLAVLLTERLNRRQQEYVLTATPQVRMGS